MEYNNPFLIGKLNKKEGCASQPQTSDNRTVVIFVGEEGEFNTTKGNENIAKVYPKAKEEYRRWWRSRINFRMGEIQSHQVSSDTEVVFVLANDETLEKAVDKLGRHCSTNKTNVHLNDDNWDDIKDYVEKYLLTRGVNVNVYS